MAGKAIPIVKAPIPATSDRVRTNGRTLACPLYNQNADSLVILNQAQRQPS
jgi:hypothetical protein